MKYHGTGDNTFSSDSPCSTLTTTDRVGLVQSEYLLSYHSNSQSTALNQPCPTITTKDKMGVVQAEQFIALQYSQGQQD
ncbi:hypothetical protein [Siphonobacter curvatus]|uniref:Uncharacterized protein n=1 Tax=Siphonobacter curvatus TaxID=2094562 RepID=A0A2S7IQ88_9BACT|nr:hypothetical protein [Siphonobacter curvatus]PQA59829.1 hypothetical protein C5O19_09465 [Siphonobacter curvatus]